MNAIQVLTTCFWIAARFTALALAFQGLFGFPLPESVVPTAIDK